MKKIQGIAFWVILTYLWVMILFGAIVMETFMVYPNIFHDPSRSLELGLEFMSVRAPSDFFPPLGFFSFTFDLPICIFSNVADGIRTHALRRAESRHYYRVCLLLFKNTCKIASLSPDISVFVRPRSRGLVYCWCTGATQSA